MADPIVPTSSSGVVWLCAEAKGLVVSGVEGRGQGFPQPFSDVPAAEPEVPQARKDQE